ncbi:lasso peptide biosynthesis B2 protein [Hyphomonas oceanitis]|uniref:lasso peptide biosynthesis B2 protein n=1 Tax=Hyphomonas oceanitis TaxID=81033 RepID=UPI0030014988
MQTYWLNPNVHFCECDDALIFLDVTRDMYFRFTGAQRDWFEMICASSDPGDLPEPAARFADRLTRRHVITRSKTAGKPLLATAFAPPRACLSQRVDPAPHSRALETALGLSVAALSSWIMERSRNFEGVVNGVAHWKQQAGTGQCASVEHVMEQATGFHALTPYFFSTRNACRFRSIVLMKYLTRLGIVPDWVFGVRLCPFGAHCWVEYNGVILNENSDTVAEFRPIMSV